MQALDEPVTNRADTDDEAATECYAFFRRLKVGIAHDLEAPLYETEQDDAQTREGDWFRRDLIFTIGTTCGPLRVPMFARKVRDGTFQVRVADREEVDVRTPDHPKFIARQLDDVVAHWIDHAFFHPE
jgi:hypothetical protein